MGLSARGVALVVAGVLGLGGGAATALLVDAGAPGKGGSSADPLGLGIGLSDLECTGRSLLVIGWGNSAAALAAPLADNSSSRVRYLRTGDSCDTLYGREKGPTPAYAAYLGPFGTIAEACELRMTVLHRGDLVTVLRSGNDQAVRCPCHLPAETFPVLQPGMAADAETSPWVRSLQQLLVDIDEESFPSWRASGVYDAATEGRVRELQAEARIEVTGIVDTVMWRSLRDRVCDTYDY
jgi:peptidoglycan hydrolase-like protein with peptidoglycan-binding domain